MAYKSTKHVARILTDFAELVCQGIVFVDLEDTICFANTAWVKMHGYAKSEELIGKNISICHSQQQLAAGVQAVIEEAKRKGCFAGFLEHARLDGSLFQTQAKIIMLSASGKEVGYAIFAVDLSEHERFEQLLTELKLANQQLQERVGQLCKAEQSLMQEMSKIKAENYKLKNEMLNCGDGEEQSEEASSVREKPLFDSEKLKSLADLAKRLAIKREISTATTERIPIKELPSVTPQPKPYEVIELIYPPCPTENLSLDQQ
jgi:PAS domain S-box-containing protein